MDPANPQVLYLGLGDPFDGTGIGLVKSTDGGTTWSAVKTLGTSRYIRSIQVAPNNSSLVLIATEKGLFRSTNAGSTFSSVASVPASLQCWDIAWTGGSNFLVSVNIGYSPDVMDYNQGAVYRSTDAGATWTRAAALPGMATGGGQLHSIAFDPTDHKTVYVCSTAFQSGVNRIWRTTNSGTSWTALDKNSGLPTDTPINMVMVDPGDRNVVYAATHLGLYRSSNSGTSWVRWGAGLPLVNVTDLYISPDSSKVRVATYGRGIWELTVPPSSAPIITSQPQAQSVFEGQTATFTVTATGTDPLTYQWYKGTTALNGATAFSYTTPMTTLADNGSAYSVKVSNAMGSETSASALLTVQTPPEVVFSEVEPNESRAAGNLVADNVTKITGTIGTTTDGDYFKLKVGAGRTLKVAMTGPTGSTYNYDLYLYSASGSQLASGTSTTTTDTVTWKNSGTAVVEVAVRVRRIKGNSTTLPYSLAITR